MGDLDEGSHEGLESREVQVITPRIGIDTYSQFLRTPGFLSIQLRAEGATTEDLLQFPARISKEDGSFYLPWVEAQIDFNQASRTADHTAAASSDYQILEVGVKGCSQETLHQIITSIYSQTVAIDGGNAEALLVVADFLQASWMVNAIKRYVKDVMLPNDSMAAFKIGCKVPSSGIRDTVIRGLAAAWQQEEIVQMIILSQMCSIAEQCQVLGILCKYATLDMILEVLCEAHRHEMSLSSEHMKQLLKEFPGCDEVLECLIDEDNYCPPPRIVGQRLQLAKLGMSARLSGRIGVTWRIPISKLDQHGDKDHQIHYFSSPLTLPKGRSFQLQIKASEGGKWDLFVRPCGRTCWMAGDRFHISCVGRACGSTAVAWSSEVDGSNDAFGYGEKISNWLEAADEEGRETGDMIFKFMWKAS